MLKARNLTVVGLALAALGVVTPILWDMWSKPHNLAFVVSGRTLLIENSERIENLKVTIGGREIEKLFSTEVVIENIGWRLISKDDIIKPLLVTFSDTPILGVALKKRFPENLDCSTNLVSPTEMEVVFDVLNRGESLTLSVLTEREPTNIRASIRAKNFSALAVSDHLTRQSLFDRMPTHVLLVIAFSVLYIFSAIRFGRREFGPLRRDAFSLATLSPGFSKDSLREFLNRNIWSRLTERQRERLNDAIDSVDPADETATKELADQITYEALNCDASGGLAITIGLAIIALLYGVVRLMVALVV